MPTVLVVDDEALFRTGIVRLLAKRGFEILEADCAKSALAQLANPGTNIDLILVDVVLPNTNGLALAERARDLNPNLKVLLMSGYPIQTLERHFGMSKELLPIFLHKPFEIGTLVDRILELLRGAEVGGGAL